MMVPYKSDKSTMSFAVETISDMNFTEVNWAHIGMFVSDGELPAGEDVLVLAPVYDNPLAALVFP